MNGSREVILGRIRRALIRPGAAQHQEPAGAESVQSLPARVGSARLLEQFQEQSARVGGEPRLCTGIEAALTGIQDLVATAGYRRVAVSNHEICRRHRLAEALSDLLPEVSLWSETGDANSNPARRRNSRQLAQADLCLTGAEFLIAESGTVLIASTGASRQISLLPTAHLVLATPDQVYPDLAAVFEQLGTAAEEGRLPAALTMITGPSRTADIEKVLIKGAHGPVRQLTWVIGEEL
ncbi:MAG: LUD domain-containing protein [Acidobacteria bacterium]|nr:LUD domain-containing protein [Acidobacteriota bacterium]